MIEQIGAKILKGRSQLTEFCTVLSTWCSHFSQTKCRSKHIFPCSLGKCSKIGFSQKQTENRWVRINYNSALAKLSLKFSV